MEIKIGHLAINLIKGLWLYNYMSISTRKNINVATLEKVKTFLKSQKKPVYKSEIVRELGVDYNSLKIALGMLKIKTDKEDRIKIC